jgi:hypothetical protein
MKDAAGFPETSVVTGPQALASWRARITIVRMILYTRGADKSLARPGRKQVTATKLGIYSIHSPRSSIHFLGLCSNFWKPLKKFRMSVKPGLRGSNDLHVGRKIATFKLFLSVQGTGGSLTGPDPENRVGAQDTGSPGRPLSSGLQVPSEHVVHVHLMFLSECPEFPSAPCLAETKKLDGS